MTTLAQIFNLRITINDPPDIIQILSVNDFTDLPASPKSQTAYYVKNDAAYLISNVLTGATLDNYEIQSLFLSNSVISNLIDIHGFNKAVYKAILLIMPKLANKLLMVRNTNGAESIEYISLLNLQSYYKKLMADFKDDAMEKSNNNTGRTMQMKTPAIAGGNL
jgi:hypothetical protein